MSKKRFATVITEAFVVLDAQNRSSVKVARYAPYTESYKRFPSGGFVGVICVSVSLLITRSGNFIKIAYGPVSEGKVDVLPFMTAYDKQQAILHLRCNGILPSRDQILQAAFT